MKHHKTASTNTIGNTIKQLRLKRGWKQSDIATKLSISIAAFSKIEAGITVVNLRRLSEIATVLDVTLHYILSSDKENLEAKNEEKVKVLKAEIALKEEEFMKLQHTAILLYEEIQQKQNFKIKSAS